MRRETELGIRAALGAGATALRRTLLAESLLLCVAGAAVGMLIADPMLAVLAHYISRYSIRALGLTVEPGMLWVGAGLAVLAAALLAFVPRLPSSGSTQAFGLAGGGPRVTGSANRKLRVFAVVQIAASFVLVASAGASLKTLFSLQAAKANFDTHNVLVVNVPVLHMGKSPDQVVNITTKRYGASANCQSNEPVAIVSESVARRMFPTQDALNHHLMWTDPILQVVPQIRPVSMRIIGIAADLDDADFVPKPMMTVYRPAAQEPILIQGRLFVHTRSNPYALVTPITHIMHSLSADQPVEHAATLDDIRAEVISPDRLNALVFGVFAAVALLIAVVGVAGVLAFSVSGRTREFGIRLAVGSQPRTLLLRVITEGVTMAILGLALGLAWGLGLAQLAGAFMMDLKTPGALPVAGSAIVLLVAAITASVIPAARAARVDVIQALRNE